MRGALLALALALGACTPIGGGSADGDRGLAPPADDAATDRPARDGGVRDGGAPDRSAPFAPDMEPRDRGQAGPIDRGPPMDGGSLDGSPLPVDAAPPDAAPPDAALTDMMPPDAAPPDAGPPDAAACAEGERRCAGRCVDPRLDPAHCGACDVACPGDGPTRLCLAGACEAPCPDDRPACEGRCVDLTSDPSHCGACGARCPLDDVGQPRCVEGRCALECPAGWTACGGRCAETATDPEHCGGCGQRCPAPDVGEAACVNGACRALRCGPSQRACGGGCWPCPTEGVAEVGCRGRQCVAVGCAPGFVPSRTGQCLRRRVERVQPLPGAADWVGHVDATFDDRGWLVTALADRIDPVEMRLSLLEDPLGAGVARALRWGSRRLGRRHTVQIAVATLPGDRQVVAWAHSGTDQPEVRHGARLIEPGTEDQAPFAGRFEAEALPAEALDALALSAWLGDDDAVEVSTVVSLRGIDQRLPHRLTADALLAEPPADGRGLTRRGPHGDWHDVVAVAGFGRGLVWRRRAPGRPLIERALPEASGGLRGADVGPDGPVVLYTEEITGALWLARWRPIGWLTDRLVAEGGAVGGDVEVTADGGAACWVTADGLWWASAEGDWVPEQVAAIDPAQGVSDCAVAVHPSGAPAVLFLAREGDAARLVYIGPRAE